MKELITIQNKLKAEKSQFNKFGNYNYRSLEDIVEALKPLMKETSTFLTLTDEIREVAGRIYIVATATISSEDGATTVSTTGWAREAPAQKGMSDAQVTGSTSTYARKYALNGLFAIDDTKDDDSKDKNNPLETLKELIKTKNTDQGALLKYYKVAKVEDLNDEQINQAINQINSK
jgi:hypothetical protein